MMMEILDRIPFSLDADSLTKRMFLTPGSDDAEKLAALVETAAATARPKAVYAVCFIQAKDGETVTVDGVDLVSRTLARNLQDAERVFPFVATCGREVERISFDPDDFLTSFWWEEIKADLLGAARRHLKDVLTSRYRLGKTAAMSPGSGDRDIWRIEQQPRLFSLLGDVDAAIGVTLSESCLMSPIKSLSGIRFPNENDFRSCQVCRRKDCPSRSAPFDPVLWKSCQH
jgi:hypothetical protein